MCLWHWSTGMGSEGDDPLCTSKSTCKINSLSIDMTNFKWDYLAQLFFKDMINFARVYIKFLWKIDSSWSCHTRLDGNFMHSFPIPEICKCMPFAVSTYSSFLVQFFHLPPEPKFPLFVLSTFLVHLIKKKAFLVHLEPKLLLLVLEWVLRLVEHK